MRTFVVGVISIALLFALMAGYSYAGTVERTNVLTSIAKAEIIIYLGNDGFLGMSDPSLHPSVHYRLTDAKMNNDESVIGHMDELLEETYLLRLHLRNLTQEDNDFELINEESRRLTGFTFLDRLSVMRPKLQEIKIFLEESGINSRKLPDVQNALERVIGGIIDIQEYINLALGLSACRSDVDCLSETDLCCNASTGLCDEKGAGVSNACTEAGTDTDGDETADAEDLCPFSPDNAPTLVSGCTALDMLQRPEMAMAGVTGHIEWSINEAGRVVGTDQVAEDLLQISDLMMEVQSVARGGSPCETTEGLAAVEREVGTALATTDGLINAARTRWERAIPAGDVSPEEEEYDNLLFLRKRIVELSEAVEEVRTMLGETCAATLPIEGSRGVVRSIEDSQRRIELADGRVFGMAEPMNFGEPGIAVGVDVVLDGLDFGDGTGVATDVVAAEPVAVNPNKLQKKFHCLALRFVPVQLRPPLRQTPVILHSPAGYRENGIHRLEAGMGVAAEYVCPPKAYGGLQYVRYSMEILINGSTVAADLDAFDGPVWLPGTTGNMVLTVNHRKQNCTINLVPSGGAEEDCTAPQVWDAETFDLQIVEKGAYCAAQYSHTLFSVDDRNPQHVRPAVVESWSSSAPGPVPPGIFEAEGYAAYPPLTPGGDYTSSPNVVTIVQGQEFAIRNDDFYPIYPTISPLQEFYARMSTGVKAAGGLRWPHIRGLRNGAEFSYSCTTPKVIRDVINFFCDFSSHAYYRMPFGENDTGWYLSQGADPNSLTGTCTHAGAWAYDMGTDCGAEILVSRNGRVTIVRDDENFQQFAGCTGVNGDCPDTFCCTSPPCLDNVVRVEHQDGTFAHYRHMGPNDVFVQVGQIVRRGQLLGLVGTTGQTSGPHLHITTGTQMFYEAVSASDPMTILECYDPVPPNGPACSSPFTDLRSNNVKIP